ncbi:glucose-1-phosphate cytidylyltransferase [bacterium]|nr:glucose-1-phosphate cytidylyltransferase [bacterium]
MKVVILAGGLGTRLMEETESRPKPMVEIGGRPILWHIIKMFGSQGFKEFVICLGYKSSTIKEYFTNYYVNNSNFTIDLKTNQMEMHSTDIEDFKITLVDTGLLTNTAGRIKKVKDFVGDSTFILTYGDGLSDLNLDSLVNFHKSHGKLATLTSVQAPGRFGNLDILKDGSVRTFIEKPEGDGSWINGGFFVLEPEIFRYLKDEVDDVQWEKGPLVNILKDNELMAFKHSGFWKCMDALRDRVELESIWSSGKAPWKMWN